MMEKEEGDEGLSAFRPWADLPVPLAEVVLGLLPLVDYIHFGTVCRSWQSIQREHRLRNSPSPPPMPPPLPWLVSYDLCPPPPPAGPRGDTGTDCDDDDEDEGGGLLKSYSPLEKKHYHLPLPPGLRRSHHLYCLASCRGWLLMTSHEPHGRPRCSSSKPLLTEPFLFNPITRWRIPLPPLSITKNYGHRGALSAPPTDPECTVLFVDYKGAFLHRLSGGGWTRAVDSLQDVACSAIACGGKFYCQYYIMRVGVIDSRLPELRMLRFDWDLGMPRPADWDFFRRSAAGRDRSCLVEHDGEVCILLMVRLEPGTIEEFRVFRADLSAKEWVRVGTLADCTILVSWPCALSLVAADVGLERNTIYCGQYSQGHDNTCWWRAFDFDTGSWIGGTQVSYLEVVCRSWYNCWLLPTLDWAGTIQAGQ